ncbi:hypothetical protein DL771_002279 [Monosporascus sp. 5C6A]|nr:hypothetical protein DL771_002279 [Monosporascus sp. 5C6A]
MTAPDHHLLKRRRLEDSSSFTHTRDLSPNTPQCGSLPSFEAWDGNSQSFPQYTDNNNSTTNGPLPSLESYTSQHDLQESVRVDGICAIGTSIVPDDTAEAVCFGTFLDLFSREGVEFELLWMTARLQKGTDAENKAAVWATLYGPRDLAPDLRDLFQELELYLQDPIHALRDVAYFNPQRFFNKPAIRTTDFQVTPSNREQISTVKDEDLVATDVLDSLITGFTLHETQGPPYILTELKSHQKQGLTFMIRRESGWRLQDKGQDVWSQANDNLGRIMKGFKTCEVNWQDSRQRHAPSSAPFLHLSREHFTWQRHHGQQRIQETSDVGFHDIVLTTYTTLAKEWQNQERSPVFSHDWHRVVLDEAHEIKDLSTSKARAACALRASCRWAVTRTPIQNRLSELFSLFYFLRLNPYCEKRSFDEGITNPWLRGEERGLQALVKLLGYTMLRRSKNAIILPGRQDHRRFLKLSAQEQHAYDIAKQKAIKCLEDSLVSSQPQKGYKNALQKINALRVICELGYSPKPGLQATLPTSVAYDNLLSPGTPDGSSTPSSIIDDIEDDDCGLETDRSPCGDISSRLQECFPSCTTSRTGLSPCLRDPSTEFSVSSGQWPTKIQALIEDLQSCAVGSTRSVGIGCVQIDGKLNSKKRSQVINAFSKNEAVQVLLLSLGCGAVGNYGSSCIEVCNNYNINNYCYYTTPLISKASWFLGMPLDPTRG